MFYMKKSDHFNSIPHLITFYEMGIREPDLSRSLTIQFCQSIQKIMVTYTKWIRLDVAIVSLACVRCLSQNLKNHNSKWLVSNWNALSKDSLQSCSVLLCVYINVLKGLGHEKLEGRYFSHPSNRMQDTNGKSIHQGRICVFLVYSKQ